MEPIDLVPSGYRFLPTAEQLLVDYLANWVAGAPPWPRCRLRGRLRHRAVESSRQRSAGGLFLCGAQAQEQRRLARRSKGRQRFLTLYKSKKPLSPWSAGARWWSGERAAFLSTMAGGRTPGGRCTSSRCVRLAASRHEFSVTSREARIVPTPAAPPSKRLRPP
ncbi:unnamed protein product [Musa acuminata subsp. burmannicoides]